MIPVSLVQPPPSPDMSMTDVESSVQDLVKMLERKKKLYHLFDPNSCQSGNSLTRFLESSLIRIITIVLLTLDLILTILELSSSIVSCSGRDERKSIEVRLGVFHWAGTAIVCLLLAKSVALAIGLRLAFFKRPGYVLDGAVLVLALVLEVGLEKRGGGLIVVVSLWRIARIVEGAFELSDQAIEKKMEAILSQVEAVEEENRTLKNEVAEKDRAVDELQRELNKYYVPTPKDVGDRLELLARVNGIELAEKYFDSLKDNLRADVVYGAMLRNYEQQQDVEKAEDMMQKMRELDMANNSFSYNNMIHLYSQTGRHDKIDLLVQEMDTKGIAVDIITRRKQLSGFAASDMSKMEKILEDIKEDSKLDINFCKALGMFKELEGKIPLKREESCC